MKMNWMKYVGMMAFAGALLVTMPAAGFAEEGEQSTGHQDEKTSVLNIQLEKLPIVGNVSVQLPKQTESEEKSLANVQVNDGLVDDVQVDIAPVMKTQNEESISETHAVAAVKVDTTLTESVQADFATKKTSQDETGSESSAALVTVKAEELPVVGETTANVVSKDVSQKDGVTTVDNGVVQADIKESELLGDTHVGVAEKQVETDEDGAAQLGQSVVEVTVDDAPILEDSHVGVVDEHIRVNEDGSFNKDGGVVDATVGEALGGVLEDTHVGVVDEHIRVNEDGSFNKDGGVVDAVVNDVLGLGGLHLGVLDEHINLSNDETNRTNGLLQLTLLDKLLGDTAINLLANKEQTTEDGTYQKQGVGMITLDLPLLGAIDLDLLTRESFVPAAVELPEEDTEEPTPDPGDGDTGTTPEEDTVIPIIPVVPAQPNNPDSGNGTPDEGTDETDNGMKSTPGNSSGDTDMDNGIEPNLAMEMPKNPTIAQSGIGSNWHGGSSNSEMTKLPQTGGWLDGSIMLLIGVLTLLSGAFLRKWVIQ